MPVAAPCVIVVEYHAAIKGSIPLHGMRGSMSFVMRRQLGREHESDKLMNVSEGEAGFLTAVRLAQPVKPRPVPGVPPPSD